MVSPRAEISSTLPACTCCRKNGEYGTWLRSGGPPVKNASAKLRTKRPAMIAKNRRLRGNIGGRGAGGAPRPSGAGSTRQPRRSSSGFGDGAVGELAGPGSGMALLQQAREVRFESRVADRRGLHAVDRDAVARGEAGHGAEHGEPVVAVRGDRAAAQPARAAHREAVVGGLDVGAEAEQSVDHGGDAVGLLDAQLLCAAHDGLAFGEAA